MLCALEGLKCGNSPEFLELSCCLHIAGTEKRNWVGSERICAVSWQMEEKWEFNEETGPASIDRILPNPENSLLLEFAHRLEAGDLPF